MLRLIDVAIAFDWIDWLEFSCSVFGLIVELMFDAAVGLDLAQFLLVVVVLFVVTLGLILVAFLVSSRVLFDLYWTLLLCNVFFGGIFCFSI